MPTHKLKWLPTRQPIVTDLWKTSRPPLPAAVFTSVANWSTSGLKDIEWRGEKYLWSKSREFLRFVAAPKKSGETFELATNIKDAPTRAKFDAQRLALPFARRSELPTIGSIAITSGDSKGEFTVAKDQYVRLNTGWFSDRSGCYLAAGRPVITQETGVHQDLRTTRRPVRLSRSLGEIAEAVKSDQRRLRPPFPRRLAKSPASFSKPTKCCAPFSNAPASSPVEIPAFLGLFVFLVPKLNLGTHACSQS